ncbi:MAG TPA: ATP-binding protein [Solirubrobacterales bacterium]|nr:ATP-binding protein [Solirubrobacterales bacterium]
MEGSDVEIELPARPESVALAREAVSAEADRLGMAPRCLDDLRTVVTEAFTNAVRYAYEEDVEGRVAIAVSAGEDVLCLTIRDFGVGIFPRPERELPSLHMGLPIIGALSEEFHLTSRRGRGTELTVCMPMGEAS